LLYLQRYTTFGSLVCEEDVTVPSKEEPAYPLDEEPADDGMVEVEPTPEPNPEELLKGERDKYLRLAAEFDNYRKRTERDMAEFKRRAADNMLLAMLDVVDNLDRALETSDGCTVDELATGLRAIRNQMGIMLERESVEPIDVVGLKFDPYFMEAVMRMPSDEVGEGHVVTELQRGYKSSTYVLRPSKVVVSSGPKTDTDA